MNYTKNKETGLYEAPTEELRQVMSRADKNGQWEIEVVTSIQRKWLVQDGETFTRLHLPTGDKTECLFLSELGEYVCCNLKEEWRDLPAEYV